MSSSQKNIIVPDISGINQSITLKVFNQIDDAGIYDKEVGVDLSNVYINL